MNAKQMFTAAASIAMVAGAISLSASTGQPGTKGTARTAVGIRHERLEPARLYERGDIFDRMHLTPFSAPAASGYARGAEEQAQFGSSGSSPSGSANAGSSSGGSGNGVRADKMTHVQLANVHISKEVGAIRAGVDVALGLDYNFNGPVCVDTDGSTVVCTLDPTLTADVGFNVNGISERVHREVSPRA